MAVHLPCSRALELQAVRLHVRHIASKPIFQKLFKGSAPCAAGESTSEQFVCNYLKWLTNYLLI